MGLDDATELPPATDQALAGDTKIGDGGSDGPSGSSG